eukprot:s2224_g10.t1
MGDLVSANFSRVLAIHVKEFCSIICQAPAVQVQAHGYAVDYVEKLKLEMQLCDLPSQNAVFGRQQSMMSLTLQGRFQRLVSVFTNPAKSARVSPRP